jgi:hypothetical protein
MGAIRLIGRNVVILDRLGGFYRYEVPNGPFEPLSGIPALPNNIEAYLASRPGGPVNLADAPNDEVRARDIIYLSDRGELAVSYGKFDEPTGAIRTVVSVIPFDVAGLRATGSCERSLPAIPFHSVKVLLPVLAC